MVGRMVVKRKPPEVVKGKYNLWRLFFERGWRLNFI
jgi:hypothetical protein